MTMASATIHTDETLDTGTRAGLVKSLNNHTGVHACSNYDKSPHILIVQFDPDVVTGHALVQFVLDAGIHARMVG